MVSGELEWVTGGGWGLSFISLGPLQVGLPGVLLVQDGGLPVVSLAEDSSSRYDNIHTSAFKLKGSNHL